MKKAVLTGLVIVLAMANSTAFGIDFSRNRTSSIGEQIQQVGDSTYSRRATNSATTYYDYSNRQSAQETSDDYSGRNNSYTPTTTNNSGLGWKMYDDQ